MTLKFLKDIGHGITAPYENLGHTGSKVVNTLHNDAKGITKGMYSLGKDVTGSLQQLTSPIALIVIGAVIVVVVMARK